MKSTLRDRNLSAIQRLLGVSGRYDNDDPNEHAYVLFVTNARELERKLYRLEQLVEEADARELRGEIPGQLSLF